MRPYAAALSLGSNIPPETLRLRRAVSTVGSLVRVVRLSSVWETSPMGPDAGGRSFLNVALSVISDVPPPQLLVMLKKIEVHHGRRVSRVNAPRPIDIDIVWADVRFGRGEPALPHPRFRSRNFVLEPLREIRFDRMDALTHSWISSLEGSGEVRCLGPLWQRSVGQSAAAD